MYQRIALSLTPSIALDTFVLIILFSRRGYYCSSCGGVAAKGSSCMHRTNKSTKFDNFQRTVSKMPSQALEISLLLCTEYPREKLSRGKGGSSCRFDCLQKFIWGSATQVHISSVVSRKPKVVFFGRFFLVVFVRFFATENRLLKVGFSVAQKKRNRKTNSVFLGRFFHVPYVKNAHISVWKPCYGWTHGQLRHTVAAAAQQQQQRMGAVVGVGRLNT